MQEDHLSKHKRIAKNTVALYFRTFITMIVGLYTSRVLLEALGVDNYGIFNVVGGIVSFGTLITGAITTGISRFITYSLGEGDTKKMETVFSTTVNVQIIMAVIAAIALEIGGLWFLNSEANIPKDSIVSAQWVLQCSILTMVIGLISVPYNATIIAHEKMSLYAYTSIIEALLKLAICFVISYYGGNRLILYAVLLVLTSLAMRLYYGWYCAHHFSETKYRFVLDKSLLKSMSGYSGWILFGQTALVLNTQGVNMLVNVFFGLAYNVARGIAFSVNGCIQKFVSNFMMAFSPQITKSYAAKDMDYCLSLTYRGSRLAWYLMLVFIVPVFTEAHMLLKLWLGEVPEFATEYLRFAVFESLALSHGNALITLINATGKMRRYQLEVTSIGIMIFPITWLCYKLGFFVWCSNITFIIIYFLVDIPRFRALKKLTNFSVMYYIKNVLIYGCIITALSMSLPMIVNIYWSESATRFFVMVPATVIWTIAIIYLFGLQRNEKDFIISKIKSKFIKSKVLA